MSLSYSIPNSWHRREKKRGESSHSMFSLWPVSVTMLGNWNPATAWKLLSNWRDKPLWAGRIKEGEAMCCLWTKRLCLLDLTATKYVTSHLHRDNEQELNVVKIGALVLTTKKRPCDMLSCQKWRICVVFYEILKRILWTQMRRNCNAVNKNKLNICDNH